MTNRPTAQERRFVAVYDKGLFGTFTIGFVDADQLKLNQAIHWQELKRMIETERFPNERPHDATMPNLQD